MTADGCWEVGFFEGELVGVEVEVSQPSDGSTRLESTGKALENLAKIFSLLSSSGYHGS